MNYDLSKDAEFTLLNHEPLEEKVKKAKEYLGDKWVFHVSNRVKRLEDNGGIKYSV